jgi:hypothetical protein
LLVIETDRRHIGKADRLKSTNVNACLHSGCDAEEINASSRRNFVTQKYFLKSPLSHDSLITISLARKLLAVQSKRRIRAAR